MLLELGILSLSDAPSCEDKLKLKLNKISFFECLFMDDLADVFNLVKISFTELTMAGSFRNMVVKPHTARTLSANTVCDHEPRQRAVRECERGMEN